MGSPAERLGMPSEARSEILPSSANSSTPRVQADSAVGLDVDVPFRGIADVIVSLELKDYKVDEARLGPAILLRADVPTVVRDGKM